MFGLKVYASASVENKVSPKPKAHSVERCKLYTIVCSETQYEYRVDLLLAEIIPQSGVFDSTVIEESAVTVNFPINPFLENTRPSLSVQSGSKVSTAGLLHAMNRPKDLGYPVDADAIANLLPHMIRCEALVVGRVPVLGGYDEIETGLLIVSDSNHLIAVGHSQSSSGEEIVLDVN
jgi:hypothetical protein